MKTIVLLLIFIIFLNPSEKSKLNNNWRKEIVGQYEGGWLYEVQIGDARNEGKNRIYVAGFDGWLIEWTYENNKWSYNYFQISEKGKDKRLICLWIGNGRNDGKNRIYASCVNGNLFEISFINGKWEKEIIFSKGFLVSVGGEILHGDTLHHIYTGGYQTALYELEYQNSKWNAKPVTKSNKRFHSRDIWAFAIGNGQNDGVKRIYCPEWGNNRIYEYSFESNKFKENKIEMKNKTVKTEIGNVMGDNRNHLFVAEKFGHIYELNYHHEKGWSKTDIQPEAKNLSRYGLCIGNGRNDGKDRLYSVAQRGSICEHNYENNKWSETTIDAISGATVDCTLGNGRNDDTIRVYVPSVDGHLYEFTYIGNK